MVVQAEVQGSMAVAVPRGDTVICAEQEVAGHL